jgi:cobalt/nickel transport system permease protein
LHLPDGILAGHTEAIATVIATGGIATAAVAARAELRTVPVARVAAVGGLIFAGQMVNVPVASGTSGHLIGAALAVALLGPGLGIVTTAVVLAVQALLFADGGVSSMGANIVNMAVVPGVVAAAVLGTLRRPTADIDQDPADVVRPGLRLAVAAGLSMVAAASAFSVEYAAGSLGGDSALDVTGQMLAVHLPIAVAEIAITLGAVAALRALDRRPGLVLGSSLLVAAAVAPWASGAPDGLERVAIDRGFASLTAEHSLAASPLADYAIAGVSNPALTVAIAGVVGALVVAGVLTGLGRLATVDATHR